METFKFEPDVVENLGLVKASIDRAAAEAGRPAGAVNLTVVSKRFEGTQIEPLLVAGQRVFGENRVQEAQQKWPVLRARFEGCQLRLIGPLQSNKALEAVTLFDVIETLDRPKLAAALARAMEKSGRRPECLVQVNTGEESQKAGIAPTEAHAFIQQCLVEYQLPVTGLMCIPPVNEPPAPHFSLLHKLAEESGLSVVSMGMSSDYEIACQLGASHVRVGSAIFGVRPA